MKSSISKRITKLCYVGLLLFIPLWHVLVPPSISGINPWLITFSCMLPLLFPLKGILKNNPYTYAWSGFIALLYITHAVEMLMSSSEERWLAIIELTLATGFFMGTVFFAKSRGKELGLSIRKKATEQELP